MLQLNVKDQLALLSGNIKILENCIPLIYMTNVSLVASSVLMKISAQSTTSRMTWLYIM